MPREKLALGSPYELGLLGTEIGFDIAETFAVGELSKAREGTDPSRRIFDLAIALVSINANLKLIGGEEVQRGYTHSEHPVSSYRVRIISPRTSKTTAEKALRRMFGEGPEKFRGGLRPENTAPSLARHPRRRHGIWQI